MTELGYELTAGDMSTPDPALSESRATVPQHVVYREFVNETVVLNLQTGTYHGLNPTAGLMLQAIDRTETLGAALEKLVADYGWSLEEVEPDFVALCDKLAERGLLEVDARD
jgi:hypothetical protein